MTRQRPGYHVASPNARDLTSLSERFGALLALRFAMAGAVLLAAGFAHRSVHLTVAAIAPLSITYLLVACVVEFVRRVAAARGLRAYRAMLLLDSLFILLVVAPSGGPLSGLVALFAVHLIAVTLLGSQRTGLRVALWDSLLFGAVYLFDVGPDITDHLGTGVRLEPSAGAVILTVAAFWAVTACTGYFATLNEKELRRSKEELRSLADMASKLERTLLPDEVLSVLVETTADAFKFERVVVWYNSMDGVRLLAGRGAASVPGVEGAGTDSVVLRAWAEHAPVLVKRLDGQADPVLSSLLPQAQNIAVIPLMADANPLGVIAVERGGPLGIKLPLRTLTMLNQFAAHAALALRNAGLLAEVERLAKQDSLTGLANRREFESVLERELIRSKRTGNPLSLVVLDVDHFKHINDTYGHQIGDEVLKAIAGALRSEARELDVVARYGGEEFAVILPDCAPGDALGVTDRMRAAINDLPVLSGITVSAGVSSSPWNADDSNGLVAAADEALYTSKRSGRDRVTCSTRGNTVIETNVIVLPTADPDGHLTSRNGPGLH